MKQIYDANLCIVLQVTTQQRFMLGKKSYLQRSSRMLELREISEEEYYTLINEWNVAFGIVFNKYNGNVIAFGYIREGITHYYKVVVE